MANFFAGLGNFAGGLSKGIDTGKKIQDTYEKGQLKKAYKDGIKGAEKKRNQKIEGAVKPVYEGGIKLGYEDEGGKVAYGNEKQARTAAEENTPDVMDFFMRDAAPGIGKMYLEQGKPEKATAWNDWVQDTKGRKAIEQWSGAYKSLMVGDTKDAANKFGEFYNDQIDDSVDFRGAKEITNEAGDITGFKMAMYDRDDDEEREIEVTREQMVQLGNAYNPQALFERIQSQTTKASESAADLAADDYKARRDAQIDAELNQQKSNLRMDEERVSQQLEAATGNTDVGQKFRANVDILKQQGFDDAEIRELTPRILGISNTRSGASDTDLRLNALKMLTGDYMSRRNFEGLPEEEQEAKINGIVQMIKATQK